MADTPRPCHLLPLALVLLLPACGRAPLASASPAAASATPRVPAVSASPTPSPTTPATPTSTPTATPTATPTPPVITSERIDQLEIVNQVRPGVARAVAWSPDGSSLAIGVGNRVVLQDSAGLARRMTLECNAEVHSIAISPDGLLLAVGEGNSVSLWDLAEGARIHTFNLTDQVRSVAFDSQGAMLAAAGYDREIHLWDPATYSTLGTLRGHEDWVLGIAFSPDGQSLASASMDGEVRIWDLAEDSQLQVMAAHSGGAYSVAFDPAGERLASGGGDGIIQIWVPGTGRALRSLHSGSGVVFSLAFSPDGSELAWSGLDGRVRAVDLETDEQPMVLEGHEGITYQVAFSPDGGRLASVASDGSASVWALEEESLEWGGVYGLPPGEIYPQLFGMLSNSGFVSLSRITQGARVYAWDGGLRRREPVESLIAYPRGFALLPDASLVAFGTEDGLVLTQPGSPDPPTWFQADVPYRLALSDDGALLASLTSMGDDVFVLRTATGTTDQVPAQRCGLGCDLAFIPGTHMLAIAGPGGLQLWDGSSVPALISLRTNPMREVAFTRDGSSLAALGEDSVLYILGLPGGELLHALSTDGASQSVTFDPSGALLALANGSGEAVIWDLETESILRTLRIPGEQIAQVAFDNDGWHLATYSSRGLYSEAVWTLTAWGIAEEGQ